MAALRRWGAKGALVQGLLAATGCTGALTLAGCALPPAQDPPAAPATGPATPPEPAAAAPAAAAPRGSTVSYRCEGGLRISVLFAGDSAQVAGLPHGEEVLLRDAGGVTPEQSVWSNPRLRAEFGLGEQSSRAVLHPLDPPAGELHCMREG